MNSFKTASTKRHIKIGGRSMKALFVCPNRKECEKEEGFALCNECMVEATDVVNKKDRTNNQSANTRAKRSGVLSPGTRRKKRRGRTSGDDLRSGADVLKTKKTIKCCDAHNNIRALVPFSDEKYYTKAYMEKEPNYPPRNCHCCQSTFGK